MFAGSIKGCSGDDVFSGSSRCGGVGDDCAVVCSGVDDVVVLGKRA